MKKLILPLAVCAAVVLVLGAVARPVQRISSTHVELYPNGCADLWDNQPLVVCNVEGSTFLETVHSTLVVFSSGSVTFVSSSSLPTESAGGGQSSYHVDPLVARQLLLDLGAAGAFAACDGLAAGSDIPLTTLTVMDGTTNALAHTFSFFDNFENQVYQDVQDILDVFIAGL